MSNFTKEQKAAFLALSKVYDNKVYEVVLRGNDTEINILSEDEGQLLEDFSRRIYDLVIKDFPNIEGEHEDINADAEMLVHMISDILSESNFTI